MSNKTWFKRTIKDGMVKIEGSTYQINEEYTKYNGELEGLRYIFARYMVAKEFLPYISLWGSEKYEKGLEEFGTGPECVNGVFVWAFWNKID